MGILCGTDIVEIDRVRNAFEKSGASFRDKIYTSSEIEYCEGKKAVRYQSYAARFAAKEAISKALGTGISGGVDWRDMEILNNEYGKPYVLLSGKAMEVYNSLNAVDISLSLSHSESYAVAYVVIETK